MRIFSAADIYDMEKKAADVYLISETALMENAGSALSGFIENIAGRNTPIAVLCGPGNNGGDGFAAARHLISKKYNVRLFFNPETEYKGAAKNNLEILKRQNIPLTDFKDIKTLDDFGIIVDALFGTGLKREISGEYQRIIEAANSAGGIKVAADIPSGLFADSPAVKGTVFRACHTVTFSSLKICQALYPAKSYCGKTVTVNITIPEILMSSYKSDTLITMENLPKLKERPASSHKGYYGRTVTIGGSKNMAGAVKIASLSALRSGCGLVTCAHPEDLDRNFISDIPEIMTKPFSEKKADNIIKFINDYASACSIGSGMGREKETEEFIKNVLFNINKPVVIDADGLNALTEKDFDKIKTDIVITPHIAEFARLTGKSAEETAENKLMAAKEFAKTHKAVTVLKSADMITACAYDDNAFIVNNGNTALAKGGSGDALAGVIASLIAQGYKHGEAAVLGCFILAESSRIASINKNEAAITVTDIIKCFPETFDEIAIRA